jgi:hypothetical protein
MAVGLSSSDESVFSFFFIISLGWLEPGAGGQAVLHQVGHSPILFLGASYWTKAPADTNFFAPLALPGIMHHNYRGHNSQSIFLPEKRDLLPPGPLIY